MINCIIVDDEPLARQLIASYIDELPELHLIGHYKSASEAFLFFNALFKETKASALRSLR